MSYYYKYDFISPEPTYALVKEELKSYFDSGAIDDLLFPVYTNKCLDHLGKGSYNIVEEVIEICDFEARLPDNFYAVREAWLCTDVPLLPYRSANSFYSQAASTDTIQVSPVTIGGRACTNWECTNDQCDGAQCMPERIQAVYKTNNEISRNYSLKYLLKPGNISVKEHCSLDCKNFGSDAPDSFDIRDNKFVTNFRKGKVYLIFYATDYDKSGYQLIPDNFRIKEYIEKYIKYKVFETLTNQVNDETFNQLELKLDRYKTQSDEAFIEALAETRRETAYQKQNKIKQNLNRFNMYELPTRRYWRRRNNQ